MTKAIVAWEDSVNASGGVNGHPVKVFTFDDGANPATALQDAKALVTQDHVIAFVGEMSLADAAFAQYVQKEGIPVVGGVSSEAAFLSNPDFYPSGTQLLTQTAAVVFLDKQAGNKHIGTGYCAESPVCAQAGGLIGGVAKLAGINSTSIKVSATAPSYTAPCLQLKSAGVDSFFPAINAPVAVRFIDQCAQQGYNLKIAGEVTAATTAWLKDPHFSGAILSGTDANPFDASLPAVQAFQHAMNTYAPGVLAVTSYDVIEPWAGGELFDAAAKAADIGPTSTPADVKKGLYALKHETLDGLAPPLTFTPDKPAFIPCYFSEAVKGGKFVSLNGNKPTCLSSTQAAALAKAA